MKFVGHITLGVFMIHLHVMKAQEIPQPLVLPVIDISSWMMGKDNQNEMEHVNKIEKSRVATEIDDALRMYGCFLVTGHGLTNLDFHSAISSGYKLFSIDRELKQEVEVQTGGFMRGYIGFGKESGLEEYFESKEGYSYGYSWPEEMEKSHFSNLLQGKNIWPREKTVDVKTFDSMYSLSNQVAISIMTALFSKFSQETNSSLDIDLTGGDTISIMRLFHYFSSPPSEMSKLSKRPTGSSPHTDWGLLTVITQEEDTNGLQFYLPSSHSWVDIPSIPGTMVVNGGDFLRLASGGRYVSPIHRVLSPSIKDRISYVFFFYPNYHTLLPSAGPGTCLTKSTEVDDDQREVIVVNEQGEEAEEADAGSFNTLTCLENSSFEGIQRVSFGDYITKKWEEVYRKDTAHNSSPSHSSASSP